MSADSGWSAAVAAACAGDGGAAGGRLDSGTNETDTRDAAELAHSWAQGNAAIDIGIDTTAADSAVSNDAAVAGTAVVAAVAVFPNYFYY